VNNQDTLPGLFIYAYLLPLAHIFLYLKLKCVSIPRRCTKCYLLLPWRAPAVSETSLSAPYHYSSLYLVYCGEWPDLTLGLGRGTLVTIPLKQPSTLTKGFLSYAEGRVGWGSQQLLNSSAQCWHLRSGWFHLCTLPASGAGHSPWAAPSLSQEQILGQDWTAGSLPGK
jgi:hypothetical protein